MKRFVATLAAVTLVGCTDFDDALAAFCDGGRCGSDAGRPDGATPTVDAGTDAGVDGGARDAGPDAGPCFNNVRDTTESDVDCGGTCVARCALGRGCDGGVDCATGVCHATRRVCTASTCDDGLLTAGETGLDCGGTCPVDCGIGGGCDGGSDCDSGICHATRRTCSATRCDDGLRNDLETDTDCGGGVCGTCALDGGCQAAVDCGSGFCNLSRSICVANACLDGVKNGAETDVDCGGSSCGTCGIDAGCLVPGDCASAACHATQLRCASSTCVDARLNGTETAVDCGGATCSAKCPFNAACTGNNDCSSGICHATRLTCSTSQCDDGLKNGAESDVDCGGGGSCPKCVVGKLCSINSDCDPPSCDPSGRCRLQPFPFWDYMRQTLCTRDDAAAAVLNGVIYVGGRQGSCDPSVTDPPSTMESGSWLPNDVNWVDVYPLSVNGRAGMSFVALANGRLLRIGGSNDTLSTMTATVSMSTGTSSFTGTGSMTTPRAHFATTLLPNGQVFVAGGHNADFSTQVQGLATTEYYTPVVLPDGGVSGSWDAGPTLGVNRSGSRAVVVGNNIWVMGGVEVLSQPPELANIETVPLAGGAPQSAAPMPTGRAFFGAVMAPDGRLYVVGGRERDGGVTTVSDSVTAYDPATQRWYAVTALPEGRSHGTLVVGRDNRLYYVNGRNPAGQPQATVYAYGGSTYLNPGSGQRDAGIRVQGSNFSPGIKVDVRFGQPNGPLLATFNTDINGNFPNVSGAYFGVPQVDAGTYEIYVTDVNTRYPLKTPLVVLP